LDHNFQWEAIESKAENTATIVETCIMTSEKF